MGRSISEELGRNGCKVVVVARGRETADMTVKAIKDDGGEAIAVSADLTSFDSFPYIVEQAKAAFGLPDIAIYAPVAPPPERSTISKMRISTAPIAYIVKGFAHFARAIVPGMIVEIQNERRARLGRARADGHDASQRLTFIPGTMARAK